MKNVHFFSILLLMLACFVPQAARAEYYGIKVAGVSVTSDNCENITGENIKRCFGQNSDYWVRYEPSTKTLTLHNIRIKRTGSGNRAILNESCDGLTIVFDDEFYLEAQDASPIRLNANTTITSTKGLYGWYDQSNLSLYSFIWSRNSDAITISNGAQLTISNIQMDVCSTNSAAFYGNTGNEKLILVDAFVLAKAWEDCSIKDITKLGVQNSSLLINTARGVGVKNLKEFTLVGKERMTVFQHSQHYQYTYEGYPTTTPVYYSETEQTFLSSEDNTRAKGVAILSYIPIDEQTFPDETFRNYVSEKFDDNSNGELDFLETLKANDVSVYSKSTSSLRGIEHLRFVEKIDYRSNNLTYLDLSQNKCLKNLWCSNNQITTLRLSEHPRLTTLECSNNLITNIDFSGCPKINDINISGNRINGWMTDVLESLPDVTGIEGEHKIVISNSGTNDNVCSDEQANIAKNKGWNVTVGGLDEEGNVAFNVKIGGNYITSANADDLTALPGVTKNCEDGYARYNPTTNTLYLNGVDIVNEEDTGIQIELADANPTIELGQDPVNITGKNYGIFYDDNNYSRSGTLTITTKEEYWYSEKLTVVGTEEAAIRFPSCENCVISGVARIEAKSLSNTYPFVLDGGILYVKNDAELRVKSNGQNTLSAYNLVLEDDNIVVTHPGAYITLGKGVLFDAEGHTIRDEVVIGKLREYNYYVAGTRISNANQHAVLGDTTVVFQEPAFNGGAGTLVLTNANIEAGSEAGINAGKTLYIKLEGENTINSTTYGIASKYCYIQGPGSLYVNGKYGIDAHLSKLFISDDAKVTAEGSTQYAINGQETTISGENTVVRMKCGPEARGTFRASTSLTLNDGLKIDTPESAQYVDGEIKDASGNVIKDEWVTIQYTADYGIKVAGTQVTNHNMADVLGDGTINYDPETLTLTLTDASIDGGNGSGIEAEQELHIKLEGSSAITCTRSLNGTSKGIWFKGKGFIEGPGSLSITAMYGIYAIGNNQPKPLQILDGAQVSAEGDLKGITAGITTISGEETIVNAKGGDGSFGCTALNLNDQLEITQPAGASFNLTKLAICVGRRNDIVTSWVTIQKVNKYNIYVAGTQVTSLNQADVLGDGTVSYDAETNTLTLNNANIETEAEGEGLSTQIDEVIIKLEGENSIEAPEGYGIYSDASFTITGPGSLSVTSKFEALNGSFVIEGGAKVTADSQTRSALWSFYPLAVSGSETVVMLKGAKGAVEIYGADSEEAVLSLSDGLVLGLPEGAHCGIVDVLVEEEEDMWIPYGYILDANDNNITDQWVVICSQDYIDGIESLTPARSEGKDLLYNLAGQKVGKNYKGIVIMNGRKVLKM